MSLYTINIKNVQYPLDTDSDALFWVSGAPDSGGPYSPTCFFFSSADGMRLIPATSDLPRLIAALTSFISSYPTASCTAGLQSIVDALTADNNPPAARYPTIGDTGVLGRVVELFSAPWFKLMQSANPPVGWTGTWLGPLWFGICVADIASNNYSTPPADLVASGQLYNAFRFRFKSATAVQCGRCKFDIVMGTDQSGNPSIAIASNVTNA